MNTQFITAQEIGEIMNVSRSKAYKIVKDLNQELEAKGYITIAGRCPVRYFEEKFYGLKLGEDEK